MIQKEHVLEAVKMKDYVVPSDLIRQFNVNTFIIGAVLSDLVSDKKLIATTVKIGGSPAYYAPEKKENIQQLVKYLNEKDKTTFTLLQNKKVLADTDQTPLVRVSLRTIKDYAKPIEVTINNETKLFWKWYLATDQEVQDGIRVSLLSSPQKEVIVPQQTVQPAQTVIHQSLEKITPAASLPLKKQPRQRKLKEVTQEIPQQALAPLPLDAFVQTVQSLLQKKGIAVHSLSLVKKGEVEGVVSIPTAFGPVTYFCKAKQKKKCTETELGAAFIAGQLKKLPTLLLFSGDISKKMNDGIERDYPNLKLLNMEE